MLPSVGLVGTLLVKWVIGWTRARQVCGNFLGGVCSSCLGAVLLVWALCSLLGWCCAGEGDSGTVLVKCRALCSSSVGLVGTSHQVERLAGCHVVIVWEL